MFLKDLTHGLFTYKEANKVIFKHKLWPLMSIPGIMSLCYILLMVILGLVYVSGFAGYINDNWMPGFLSGTATFVIISIMLWLMLLITALLSYKPFVLILFSPVLSYLSERVEKAVYNEEPPDFNIRDFFKDIIRGAIINLKNTGWMFLYMILAWLFTVFPVIGPLVSPILLISIESYYGGFGLMDYTLERKRFSVEESFDFAKQNRALVTGVGLGFVLLLFIPIIGWFFAPGYGTVAATLSALERIGETTKHSA